MMAPGFYIASTLLCRWVEPWLGVS